MKEENLELRMYFFVPYQLTGIQQGIQAGHAALEYAIKYNDDETYLEFVQNWKTWIILNGGTTNSTLDYNNFTPMGSINKIIQILEENNIKHSIFREPDLEYAITAVCFICDERVFNFAKYPEYYSVETRLNTDYDFEEETDYINSIGGNNNIVLRNLIKHKKLA